MSDPVRAPDVEQLLRDLEVHRQELSAHNDELRAANLELRDANTSLAIVRDGYRTLYDLAPTPYFTLDPDATIADSNQAGLRLLGAPREHVVDRRFDVFVQPDGRVAVREFLARLFARGAHQAGETVLVRSDDAVIDVLLEGVVLLDQGDGTRRALLAVVDVTTRRAAEAASRELAAQLLHADKQESLAVLAGGVAHDFNNLLVIILTSADLGLEDTPPASPLAVALGDIKHAARRAGELARQMLSYAGRGAAPIEVVDAGALLAELEPLLRASARTAQLVIDVASTLPPIDGDATQLRQLVLNLVINASEAIGADGGTIVVSARATELTAHELATWRFGKTLRAGPALLIEVRDTGRGIDAAQLERIFDPYVTTKFGGSGLGLAVVQGIVRGHHAALRVTSRPGLGTTFQIAFPVSARAVAPGPRRGGAVRAVASGTILLADDEPAVRNAAVACLEALGYAVVAAADGVDAIERFRAATTPFAAVILDVTMPRMGGVAAAHAIRSLRRDVPIVLTTGYGEIAGDLAGIVDGFLPKPFDLAGLADALDAVLP